VISKSDQSSLFILIRNPLVTDGLRTQLARDFDLTFWQPNEADLSSAHFRQRVWIVNRLASARFVNSLAARPASITAFGVTPKYAACSAIRSA
jgi:hypothetical protein